MAIQKSNQTEYLKSPITVLKGVGPKKAGLFSRLGINTVEDLINYFPSNYDDRRGFRKISELNPGELCCIKVRPLKPIVERRLKPKLSLFLLYVTDGESNIVVKWFCAPFSKPKILSGHTYAIYGLLSLQGGKKEFEMRYMEDMENQKYTGAIVPVYRATSGISSKIIADTVYNALENINDLYDFMPDRIIKNHNLLSLYDATLAMHRPFDMQSLSKAHTRFAFEELFVLSLALSSLKERRTEKEGIIINGTSAIREFAHSLPFELTDGQKYAINDICADMKKGKPMNRLIQGDVGCGKTVVAASAMYAAAKGGYKSVFMAPTEILANQHYKTLKNLLPENIRIALLTSSVKQKSKLTEEIKGGLYDVIVGTHALIQDNVTVPDLALCVIDEQHRFGVNQRAFLSSKGTYSHTLVMSATPIPRTLSLILYGDLDISVIKTLPKGRQVTETYYINSKLKERAYNFVRKQVDEGHQCYIVCPLVEESDLIEASSVEETVENLKNGALRGISVECVHGRMKADEKEEIMKRFKDNEISVLVSTTVIEVGVDVQNATVMLIENAERFGLSQLHQLRGRVGRGEDKSYCILVSDADSDNTKERMKIMTETNDGFEISRKDLELRGSGQFFGTRQHGIPELKVANLFSDAEIMQEAVSCASEIIQNDPMLKTEEHTALKARIETLFENFGTDNIFN